MSPPIAGYIPPEGTLTKHQYAYFSACIYIGTRLRGLVRKMAFITNNAVTGQRLETRTAFQWENSGGTLFMMHVTCADILRCVFDAEDTNAKSLARVCQIEEVVGKVQGGANAGWLPLVRYEEVGEEIDLAPFWGHQPDAPSMGSNVFDWTRLKAGKYKWLLNRPDVFPKFVAEVDEKRLPWGDDFKIGDVDTLSHRPLELLYLLLPYLSHRSYAMLASTSRLFRYHALTIFQPHARDVVIALRWAIPTKREYEVASEEVRSIMASEDAKLSPIDGDWFGYLLKVHRSKGMRVRQWIWGQCEEVKRVYEERLPGSPYVTAGGGQTDIAKKLEEKVGTMLRLLPE